MGVRKALFALGAITCAFGVAAVHAAPPMMFWDSYYWGNYGNLHTTPQAACANQNWATGSTEYTFVHSPDAGYGPYWCEPYINGAPYPPGTPSNIRYNAGKWIKQSYTCFDPITRTYNSNWRPASTTPWENQCAELPKATANACPVGNPVSPLTGQKTQSEPPDVQSNGPHPVVFQRTYRSDAFQNLVMGSINNTWFHNWQRSLNLQTSNSTPMIIARRGDGASFIFVPNGQQWASSNGQTRDRIVPGPNEKGVGAWQYYVAEADATEAYDAYGRLLTVTERNGWTTTLIYSTMATPDAPGGAIGLLLSVRNHFGVELKFSYDASNYLVALLTPDGKTIRFGIDGNSNPMVVWPDRTERHYNFGEDISGFKSALPGRLTGITDEIGVRYSRYAYNTSTGSVSSEEHAGGIDKLTFSYGANATLVTDGNGLTRTFNYQLAGKLRQPIGASGLSSIGDPFNTIQYDAGNNVSRTVDRNGSDTRYSYDAQGRETQRIEGYGTADAKTTTTEWHPTWNLPLKVAAPRRVDYFSYDVKGQVLEYGWYTTNDAAGSQGLKAQPSGDVTSTIWTYGANGLVATAVDKLGDTVTGQWTFTYDAQGNLASVTNMAGQTGTAVQYDAAGRLLEAVDVSGSRIKYAYDVRGRMTDIDIDGIHTRYEYDAVGQLVGVVGPFDLVTRYTYDAAHRLIQILDNITIQEAVNESSLISPFAVDRATSPSSLASISNRLASSWNAVLRWLKGWLSGVISSAYAQSAPPLPNQYTPPIQPGQSMPAYLGSSAASDLDPSLTREKATPGLYVLKFLVKVQQACGQAFSQVVDKVFNKSEPPGDCDWNKYTQLRDAVEAECKDVGAFSCRTSDARDLLQYKRAQALRCAMARTRIMRTCFRGGDEEHEIPERNAWRAVAKCDSYLAQP